MSVEPPPLGPDAGDPVYVPQPTYQPFGYPQQDYPQQGYPQPAYPPPIYPQYGYEQQPYPPAPVAPQQAPPSQRRFAIVLIAILVPVLIAAAVLAWLIGGSHSDPKKVALPQSFDGYTKLANTTSDALRSRILSATSGASFLKHSVTIEAYSKNTGDQPAMVLIAFPHSLVTDQGETNTSAVDSMLQSHVPDNTGFPAGPHGGVLKCGVAAESGIHLTACGWSDSKTGGLMIVLYPPGTTPHTVAGVANDVRDLVD